MFVLSRSSALSSAEAPRRQNGQVGESSTSTRGRSASRLKSVLTGVTSRPWIASIGGWGGGVMCVSSTWSARVAGAAKSSASSAMRDRDLLRYTVVTASLGNGPRGRAEFTSLWPRVRLVSRARSRSLPM